MRNPENKVKSLVKENDALKEIIERKSIQIEEMKVHVKTLVRKLHTTNRCGTLEEIVNQKYRMHLTAPKKELSNATSNGGKSYRPTDERLFREKRLALILKHLSI